MPTTTLKVLVPGGKASAAPPVGSSLGPLGVNIGQIVSDINKKTAVFNGMEVPVTIAVDTNTKKYEITVGTPPASALIKKEVNIEKGSSNPKADKVADILIEQIIKIAKMKEDTLSGKTLKDRVKEIIGTCNSMGILVEGKPAVETIQNVNAGKYDEEIRLEKTELTAEELRALEEEKLRLAEEIKLRREEFVRKAKEIISAMQGKTRGEIKSKLSLEKIPSDIIDELLPVEGVAAAGVTGAAQAPGATPTSEAKPAAPKKEEKKK